MKRKTFVILGALLSLANCGQYPRYPNPAAQNQKNVAAPASTNTVTNNTPTRSKTPLTSTTKNNTATDQPQTTSSTGTEKTTPPAPPKKDLVKTQLTPFDLLRTGLDYSVKKNNEVIPPVVVKKDEVKKEEPKEVKVAPKPNTFANTYVNNESMSNIFNKYAASKVDAQFSLDTYSKILSSDMVTPEERSALVEKYFEIIESNNPDLKVSMPIDERLKETSKLYSSNPAIANIVNFKVTSNVPEIETLPKSLQSAATTLAFAFVLEDKMNRRYLSKERIIDATTNFASRLKVVTNNNEDKSLISKSLRLMIIDFSKGKISASDAGMLTEFSKLFTSLGATYASDKNLKFTIVGHSQKMSTKSASNIQILKDTNYVLSSLTANKSPAFADWKSDTKGWTQLLNAKNPLDAKNRYVEIIMSSSEGN